jgi:hypothetical protein
MLKRLPNYKLPSAISELADFENYNKTIVGENVSNDLYIILHWGTLILSYHTATSKIEYLRKGFISQTTSTLVGRIVRSLPRSAVVAYLSDENIPKSERKRIARMVGIV